jgi:predicted nucleic acid-binding protein
MQIDTTDPFRFAKPNSRASLACIQCRSKHLRCNGTKPKCSRCQQESGECTYLKSRRGLRSKTTVQEPQISATSPTQISPSQSLPASARPDSVGSVPTLISGPSNSDSNTSSPGSHDLAIGSFCATNEEPFLDLYYTYFHPAHPCVLPKSFIKHRMNESTYGTTPGIKLLVMVMRFIGSLYAPKICSLPLEDQVKAELAIRYPYTTGFEVQALILYSVAAYWCADTQGARELLDSATAKALALGMNLRQFAINHSGGDPVLAESWRRTWWQLYLTDAHFASSAHSTHFGTSQRDILATVELPCDESDYCSGVCTLLPFYWVGNLIILFRTFHHLTQWTTTITENLQWTTRQISHRLRI